METVILDHPLVSAKLTLLRDKNTDSLIFRHLVEELVTLLSYEATRNLNVVEKIVETPITKTKGYEIAEPKPLVVPILRAGLGMVDGILDLVPTARVGHIGMFRNEETLEPELYFSKYPSNLEKRDIFIVDPMLATG
ncbi:MAG: uracil phosphoribosyltransferase, partial [Actinomycetes bacterium]